MISSCAMPSNRKKASHSEQDYAVGDHVKVNLHTRRIVDARVKAVIDRTDFKRLQVDFGKDETALVYLCGDEAKQLAPGTAKGANASNVVRPNLLLLHNRAVVHQVKNCDGAREGMRGQAVRHLNTF